jgi:calcium-dependent protein kinase
MFHLWAAQKTDDQLKSPYLYTIPDEYAFIVLGIKLGSGHYGNVFAAKYKGEQVAVKKMQINTPKDVKMFNREVAFMRKLHHPNILKLVDGFRLSKREYIIITEICSGGELFDAITKQPNKMFKISNAQRVAKDVLSAIQYMHDMNVVHRDLKPENILLSVPWTDGPIPPVKVIDFGLSADWKGTPLYRKYGTPYYVAPEVLQASETRSTSYGKKCDIWSLGVIVYILLCGYPPFRGDTDREIYDNISNSTVLFEDDPGEYIWKPIKKSAPGAIRFIQRLLQKNPLERPSARQAFDSSFIRDMVLEPIEHTVATDNLHKFVHMSKLKRLIRYEIAQKLTVVDKRRYLGEFGDGNKMLEDDAQLKLQDYGVEQETIKIVFNAIDVTNDGEWDVSEFVAAVMEEHLYNTYETIKRAFVEMDANDNSEVSLSELVSIVGQEDATAIFKELFPGADDQLTFTKEDLRRYFTTHQPPAEEKGDEDVNGLNCSVQ